MDSSARFAAGSSVFYGELLATKLEFRVCLLGDAGVGKSSVLKQFIQGRFVDDLPPTVNMDFAAKVVMAEDSGVQVTLLFSDIMGQSPQCLNPSFLRGCSGAVLVHDLTRGESGLASLDLWKSKLDSVCDHASTLLLGNKKDQAVDTPSLASTAELAAVKAAEMNIDLVSSVSAKTGDNIEESFSSLIDLMLARRREERLTVSPEPTSTTVSIDIGHCRARKRDKCKEC